MFALSYIRVAIIIAVLAAIIAAGWKIHHTIFQAGYNERDGEAKAELAVRMAEAVKASEQARAKEQALHAKVERIDRDFQTQKTLRIAADKRSSTSLQRLEAILASAANTTSANTSTSAGADGADPRNAIIGECSRNLVALDAAYGKLADKATALQLYTNSVRLIP